MTPTAWRIFWVVMAIVLLTGLPTAGLLDRSLSEDLLGRIEADLEARAVMADVAARSLPPEALDDLADELAEGGARFTYIDADGRVLGDSELDGEALSTVDNHGDRPEVRQARATGRGTARRYSKTLGADLFYVALPHSIGGSDGVVRVSMPLTEVDAALQRNRVTLATAGLVALILGVLGSWLAAKVVNLEFESLLAETRKLAEDTDLEPDEDEDEDDDPVEAPIPREADRLENELTAAVRALAEQRDLVRAVVDGIQDGVVALNAEGRVDLANAAALELLDWKKVPKGKRIAKRVPTTLAAHITEAREIGASEAELAIDRRTVQVATAALEKTGGLVLVLRDVTALRLLERVRRDFVANVSHELGTPIAVIRANSETLLHGGALEDPDGRVRFTEAIDRQAHRLSALVADLLQISRIESGELPLDLVPIPLAEAFAQAVEATAPEAEKRGASVTAEPTEDTVIADARALDSILENLVGNAVKYGGGTVTITSRTKRGQTRIYVSDDGPGIPAAHRERVFERFYRVDKGRSREVGGTGLGLSIVRNLAHAMGGRVGVDEAPSGGAAFWIEL